MIFPPPYYVLRASFEIPAPPPGCPRNHSLRLRRARRHHREWEQAVGVMLIGIEAITRFPAPCSQSVAFPPPFGERLGYYAARPITLQTYAFNPGQIAEAAALVRNCFPHAEIITGLWDQRTRTIAPGPGG